MNTSNRIRRPHTILVAATAFASVLLVGFLDFVTGTEISFSPFYLAPIAIGAWYAGRTVGVLTSVLAATVWLVADMAPMHNSSLLIPLWNATARLIMFLSISLLLSHLRELNRELRMKVLDRATALAAEKDGHEATRGTLRQTEETFRLLIESVKDYAIFMLDLSGNVVSWNEGAERLTGFRAQEIIDRPFTCLCPPDSTLGGGSNKSLGDALARGCFEGEGLRVRRDGSLFWAVTMITPLRDSNGQAYGFSKVIHDITHRKHLENRLLEIEEEERRRIGRDLHDVLGQDLTGIAFLSKELEEDLAARSRPEAADAARIVAYITQAIEKTRCLARGLCPVELTADGLMSALSQLASDLSEVFGIACTFTCDRPVPIHDEATALHLYRIAQEGANNALRHGQAGHIEIALAARNGRHILTIQDDGKGIPGDRPAGPGMGISAMSHRAGGMGGTLAVRSRSGGGTAVVCSIPARRPEK